MTIGVVSEEVSMAFGARALTGTVLVARYLVGELAREGEGWTEFHALDTLTNAEVEVRVVRAGLGPDSRAAGALALEAVVSSEVRHPSVLAPRDVGMLDDATPFLVTARHGAESLEDRVSSSRRLSVAEIVRIGIELSSVLAAAHARGIVHGDLRPESVLLLERDGVLLSLRVGGWGATRDVRAGKYVFASPAFAAPELLEGAGPSVASDVFAVGALLRFAAACAAMPVHLGAVIDKAMAKDPASRYADARELLAALDAATAPRLELVIDSGRPVSSWRGPESRRPSTSRPAVSSRTHGAVLDELDDALALAAELASASGGDGASGSDAAPVSPTLPTAPEPLAWTKSDVIRLSSAALAPPVGVRSTSRG
ncbi:MAG: protein kinase [Deltaproteobacteria bacterium]|nr:protein kinase [Deltaproteobacteria bacterium]